MSRSSKLEKGGKGGTDDERKRTKRYEDKTYEMFSRSGQGAHEATEQLARRDQSVLVY